jgi:hypothetical protein
MEQSGRNRWQPVANPTASKTAQEAETVAVGCDRLPPGPHGKGALPREREGVALLAPRSEPQYREP